MIHSPDIAQGSRRLGADVEKAFVSYECSTTSESVRSWYSRDELLLNHLDALRHSVSQTTGPAWRSRFGDAGVATEAVAGRVVAADGDERVFAAAHPSAGAGSEPLIAALHRTFSFRSTEHVLEWSARLAAVFAPAGARRVRYYEPSGAPSPVEVASRVEPAHRLIAGLNARLRRAAAPAGAERIRLEAPRDLSFFDRYSAIYDEFWSATPDLREYVWKETREDMEKYRSQGGLFLAYADGARGDDWCGVIAAERRAEAGLRGWHTRERVFDARTRGTGLGAAIIHRFAETLPAEEGDALFGMIHPRNQSSLRTALRSGRVDIGGYWLVPAT
jgi:hypothetical protein